MRNGKRFNYVHSARCSVVPMALAGNTVPETMELSPLGGQSEREPSISLRQRVRDKINAVEWKKVIVVIIVTFGNFLVFASISLIATFYPTTVSNLLMVYNAQSQTE